MSDETSKRDNVLLMSRIVGVFFSPKRTFEAVRDEMHWIDWAVPLLIAVIVVIAAGNALRPLMVEQQRVAIEKNESMSSEQKQEMLEQLWQAEGQMGAMTAVGGGIGVIFTALVQAVVFLFMVNVVLGGKTDYTQMFSVVSYSWLIVTVETVVKTLLMLNKGTMEVLTSLTFLLPPDMEDSVWYAVAYKIDIFTIWYLCILAIGIGIVARMSTSKGTSIVFGLWVPYAASGVIWVYFLSKMG